MEKELFLLVGVKGSGKTKFSRTLQNDVSVCISQEEFGSLSYLDNFKDSVESGVPRIIIDRSNLKKYQRSWFIDLARDAGYCVTIFDLNAKISNIKYDKPSPEEYDNYNEIGDNL